MTAAEALFSPATDLGSVPAEEAANAVIERAAAVRASDLYVTSEETRVTLAVRHLGIVRPVAEVPLDQGRRMIIHFKALAGIDIAEKRRPQDGRLIHDLAGGQRLDLRVSSIPTLFGEDLDVRLLDRDLRYLALGELGMTPREVQHVQAMLNNPGGLILVTGPTGAGKTTTLYAFLHYLNDGRRKINTIEDPIEYAVSGVRQSQINLKHGVDFPELLRGVLRQSPDVIMIGEIRDSITAQTAVRAANSGHLVLATLHAPVAAAAVQSMLNLDVHPHFLSTSLLGVIAQRLVRTLAEDTKIAFDLSDAPHTFEELRPWLEPGQGLVMFGPNPADERHPDGYAGRTGVFEVLPMSRELRRLVAEGRPARDLEARAIDEGMLEFRRAALLKVAQGLTSTEEVLRSVPTEYLGLDL
jgi:type II secretory ATPase GspE/PulE/Tfp pilus assembly ATPase PilB-like protein